MQVRKRAKSVSFGKHKEKEEEPVSHAKAHIEVKAEEKAEEKLPELTPAAKKVQEPVTEEPKEEAAEITTAVETPEEKAVEEETPSTVTPASEFLSDTPSPVTSTPTEPMPKPVDSLVAEPEPISPTLPEAISPVTPAAQNEPKPAESELSGVLSPTPPTSAFTIQGNNIESDAKGPSNKKHFIIYFLVVALISFILGLGAMAGVSYFGLLKVPLGSFSMNTQVLNKMNPLNPTPTSIPTAVPTAVPTAKPADLSMYSIAVLNGSGIKGKAAEVKTSLTEAGFKVTTSGNADKSDYTTTQIAAKKSVDKAYLDKLQAELKKSFKLDTVSSIPADSTQATDVIVTLGQETAN